MHTENAKQLEQKEIEKIFSRFQKKGEKIAKDKNQLSDLIQKTEEKSKESMNAQATGPIKELLNNVKLLASLIKDYINGSYKTIAVGSIVVIAIALLYFISPIDLIPDVVPVVGSLDDIAVIGFAMTQIAADLAAYREWKEQQGNSSELAD